MPTKKEDLPSTIKRSPDKVKRTYAKSLDNAHEQYDSEERAHRTAFSAVKHSFKKVADRWEPKDRKGPSDPRAKRGGKVARKGRGEAFGGVDYEGSTKAELYEQARKLDIEGRSSMSKKQLARAIARKS